MDTLTTPWLPATNSGGSTEKPRVLSDHFNGDATFDMADGINASPFSYQATWILHTDAADALLKFLRDHACKTFIWTMPRETRTRMWEATEWSRSSDYDQDQVQVTFEERFLP